MSGELCKTLLRFSGRTESKVLRWRRWASLKEPDVSLLLQVQYGFRWCCTCHQYSIVCIAATYTGRINTSNLIDDSSRRQLNLFFPKNGVDNVFNLIRQSLVMRLLLYHSAIQTLLVSLRLLRPPSTLLILPKSSYLSW